MLPVADLPMQLPKSTIWTAITCILLTTSFAAPAQDTLNAGNTAWMLTATILLMFMTLPGLALPDIISQVLAQAKNILLTIAFSGILSFAILKGIGLLLGLRVDNEQEHQGLDITQHNEEGYLL